MDIPPPPRPPVSPFKVIAATLIFYPLGFYYMCKDRAYYKWLNRFLYFTASLPFITWLWLKLFITPQMAKIYATLDKVPPPSHQTLIYIVWLALSVLQIAVGSALKHKLDTNAADSKSLVIITTLLLTINFLIFGYVLNLTVTDLVTPLYNLTF